MNAAISLVETPLMPVTVAQLGAGPPVVYLHDVLFDQVASDGGVPLVLDLLSASHSVFAPALPGFNDLRQLALVDDVGDYVLLLADLLAVLSLEKPHVVELASVAGSQLSWRSIVPIRSGHLH